ncbi:MAG TPA: hypothetical protein VEK57_03515 [Thermoanaerobaculia bacterium]|nr:hypothetical protein [Thermoanaerobaculia bacterium]
MATTKKASTKKASTTKASKKASKKASGGASKKAKFSPQRLGSMPVNALLSLDLPKTALMAAAEANDGCPAQVISTIEQWGGGDVQSGSDTLAQLSVNTPCTQARVNVLRNLLGASFGMSCSTTVGSIISRLCPLG